MRAVSIALVIAGALAGVMGCGGKHDPVLHTITIARIAYQPASLTIASGDTVRWVNHDIVPHTATAKDGHWDSPPLQPGARWDTVIVTRGREPYGCRFHPTMAGELEVR